MSRITVLGGTGFAGSNIVAEAAARGHEVTAVSRTAPAAPVASVTYVTGDVLDPGFVRQAILGVDVVVSALAPRGELAGRLVEVIRATAVAVSESGQRLGVVGGAGSLFVTQGGPALVDTDPFPAEFRAEANEMTAILQDLRASDESVDWFYVSPAAGFGGHAPGERLGTYRVGGDVLLTNEAGESFVSGADFALAFVDEIDHPIHRRERISIAY